MVIELITVGVFLLGLAAERLHAARCRRVAPLAFGPRTRPARWVLFAPALRIFAMTALCWGLLTLATLAPKVHAAGLIAEKDRRHLVVVLDVSPSMRLTDAGPTGKQSRMARAADLLRSFFQRVPLDLYRTSVIATYNGAKPVVVDTRDMDVIDNILGELPMHYAFKAGNTDIFAGLEEAARIARPWNPRSTVLVLLSDGDTVPATGMPKLPASIRHSLIVGVGDPRKGQFIDGHQSRQDASTLRSIAIRLGGTYHDGNEKHLSTELVHAVGGIEAKSLWAKLTRREYALLACAWGAAVLALLPVALHAMGTRWQAGVPTPRDRTSPISSQNPRKRSAPRRSLAPAAPGGDMG